jgi:hypothetical protein
MGDLENNFEQIQTISNTFAQFVTRRVLGTKEQFQTILPDIGEWSAGVEEYWSNEKDSEKPERRLKFDAPRCDVQNWENIAEKPERSMVLRRIGIANVEFRVTNALSTSSQGRAATRPYLALLTYFIIEILQFNYQRTISI